MVAILRFSHDDTAPRRVADVLAAVDRVPYLTPGEFASASKKAQVHAKQVILAAGPFTSGGPAKVYVAPCLQGGVVLTFFLAHGRNVSFACLNTGQTMVVEGSLFTVTHESTYTHAESMTHVQELCWPAEVVV